MPHRELPFIAHLFKAKHLSDFFKCKMVMLVVGYTFGICLTGHICWGENVQIQNLQWISGYAKVTKMTKDAYFYTEIEKRCLKKINCQFNSSRYKKSQA